MSEGDIDMFVKPQIHELELYVPGKSVGGIKLSANENPFGASPKIKEAVAAFTSYSRYPDGASKALKKAVAAFLQVDEGQLIFGAGGDEVIQMVSRSILGPGDNIIQAVPTFPQYEHHAIIEGATTKKIPLKAGVHDLEAMLAAIDQRTKIIWVCNPNNPTGTYVDEVSLRQFLEEVPKHIVVVLDEAYVEYADATDFPRTLKLLDLYPNVVVLRTFSKVYGLASFRIGFGIGHPDFIKLLEASRLPFNTSTVAQAAALAALSDQGFVASSVAANAAGRAQYAAFFEAHRIPNFLSQANFVFIPSQRQLGLEIGEKLAMAGYIVRAFPVGVRITIGSEADNQGVMDCLKEHLELLR